MAKLKIVWLLFKDNDKWWDQGGRADKSVKFNNPAQVGPVSNLSRQKNTCNLQAKPSNIPRVDHCKEGVTNIHMLFHKIKSFLYW